MLTESIKQSVDFLSSYDKVMLIEYLYEKINIHEDQENLKLWVDESEERLDAVHTGQLGVISYSEMKKLLL